MSAPTPAHTAVPNVQATAPKRIYLVIGEDCPADADFGDLFDELTWCRHKIDDNSIEYVRADLASLPVVQGEQRDSSRPAAIADALRRTAQGITLGAEGMGWSPDPALLTKAADLIDTMRAADIELCATLCDDLRAKASSDGQDAAAGWLHQAASHMRGLDSRADSVASESQPLAQADEKDGLVDPVSAPVEPSGATLQPSAGTPAITPAIADALAKARVFALCALRRDGYRFTFSDEVERWAELLLEAIDKATSQVDGGESSSERGAA